MKEDSRKKGFILVILLVIIAVLSVFVMEYHYSTKIEAKITERYQDRVKARYAAKAGFNTAAALLKHEMDINFTAEDWARDAEPLKLDDASFVFEIKAEDGKININHLTREEYSPEVRRRKAELLLELCDLFDLEYGIVPAIIDWVDEDDEVTVLDYVEKDNTGAEDNYYQKLETPYHAKNGFFDVITEVLLVKGATPEIFFGAPDGENEEKNQGLADFLTVYGDDKININTAPAEVLQCLIPEFIDEDTAHGIIAARELEPFSSVSELKEILGINEAIFKRISPLICVESEKRFFSIKSEGECRDSRETVNAVVEMDIETGGIKRIAYWNQA